MSRCSPNHITIDTNVFKHLLTNQNIDGHINELLSYLLACRSELCIDDIGRNNSFIKAEYDEQISPTIRGAKEINNSIFLLRYWMIDAPIHKVSIDRRGSLFVAIENVIIENEREDRIFVAVALTNGCCLVTNDKRHILDGPRNCPAGKRRSDLLGRTTRRLRSPNSDILSSQDAHKKIAS